MGQDWKFRVTAQMAEGVDMAEMVSGRAEVLNGHTAAHSSVVRGPAALPFSYRFFSFLDSHWPVTSVPSHRQ